MHRLLPEAGRHQVGQLRDHGGLGRARSQQVGLGGSSRCCRREIAGDDDDVIAGQFALRKDAAQVVALEHDHTAAGEDVADLLLQARRGAGCDSALSGEIAPAFPEAGQLADLLLDRIRRLPSQPDTSRRVCLA
jgi:hypothetical protein